MPRSALLVLPCEYDFRNVSSTGCNFDFTIFLKGIERIVLITEISVTFTYIYRYFVFCNK